MIGSRTGPAVSHTPLTVESGGSIDEAGSAGGGISRADMSRQLACANSMALRTARSRQAVPCAPRRSAAYAAPESIGSDMSV